LVKEARNTANSFKNKDERDRFIKELDKIQMTLLKVKVRKGWQTKRI
jgi:hypothetical protein